MLLSGDEILKFYTSISESINLLIICKKYFSNETNQSVIKILASNQSELWSLFDKALSLTESIFNIEILVNSKHKKCDSKGLIVNS